MIQHPGGQPKQIAIRESQIVELAPEDAVNVALDRFIHYSTDSEPGSSGAPVLNDQWQVIALHHRAVPDYDSEHRRLARDGKTVWHEEMGEDEKGWIANEGVRVSAIYRMLGELQFDGRSAGAIRDRLLYGLSAAPRTILSEIAPSAGDELDEGQEADSKPAFFQNADGYDQDFLSRRIPLPKVVDAAEREKLAKLDGTNDVELKYTHFSIVFDADRRFARFTAVNIDSKHLVRNENVTKAWRRDAASTSSDNATTTSTRNPLPLKWCSFNAAT
jgi:endonuclease G, mitochondrial